MQTCFYFGQELNQKGLQGHVSVSIEEWLSDLLDGLYQELKSMKLDMNCLETMTNYKELVVYVLNFMNQKECEWIQQISNLEKIWIDFVMGITTLFEQWIQSYKKIEDHLLVKRIQRIQMLHEWVIEIGSHPFTREKTQITLKYLKTLIQNLCNDLMINRNDDPCHLEICFYHLKIVKYLLKETDLSCLSELVHTILKYPVAEECFLFIANIALEMNQGHLLSKTIIEAGLITHDS